MASLSKEILTRAIGIETKARDFYAGVADNIKSRRGRRRIVALSRSEDRHKKLLERRYRSLFGEDFEPAAARAEEGRQGGEDATGVAEHVFTDKASALDVVSFAIGMEDRAIQYYSEQMKAVDDRRDRKLLARLVRFESKHKGRLQAEYVRLDSFFYWIDGERETR